MVVPPIESTGPRSGPERRHEQSGDAGDAFFHRKAVVFEEGFEQCRALVFLIAGLCETVQLFLEFVIHGVIAVKSSPGF